MASPKNQDERQKNRRNKSENARLSTGVLDFIAQEGYAFARAPNLRILALSGERMNAGAVNWKALKVRPQKENEPSNATACAAVFSFKITAKIFSQTAQGERRFWAPLALCVCARSSRKGKTAHRAVYRTPLLVLCKKICVNCSTLFIPSSEKPWPSPGNTSRRAFWYFFAACSL